MHATAADQWGSVLDAIIGNGWIAGGLGTGQGMAALGATIRPADTLATAGFGWLTGSVKPLQDTVDRMAGNASVIQTFADAWQRVAENLDRTREDLARSARADTAGWQGAAADGYRGRAAELVSAVRGTAMLAIGLASATRTTGEVLAGARQSAGDLLSDLVRRLISYATQAIAAEGGVTANVMSQATTMVNSYAGPISAIERDVRQTIANVEPLLKGLAGGTQATTSSWQVAAVGDPPMPGQVPDTAPPSRVSALQLLTPDEAAARLPAYYRHDHSDFYDSMPPNVRYSLRAQLELFSKRSNAEWEGFSDDNAEAALRHGPPGTNPVVSEYTNRPTITFRDNQFDSPMLHREVVVTDPANPGDEFRRAVENLERIDPRIPRDIVVQVPDGTTTDQLNGFLRQFGPVRDPGLNVLFHTPSGKLLGVGTREF